MIYELKKFGIFALMGIVAAIILCVGGVFTSKIKKAKRQIFAESLLLSVFMCVVFLTAFYVVLKINSGIVRYYAIVAFFAGFILCQKTLCKFVALIANKVYTIINGRKRKKAGNN